MPQDAISAPAGAALADAAAAASTGLTRAAVATAATGEVGIVTVPPPGARPSPTVEARSSLASLQAPTAEPAAELPPVGIEPEPTLAAADADAGLLHAAETLLADRICGIIDASLAAAEPPSGPPLYSPAVRQLFRRAWTLAAELRHRQVVTDHLVVALVTADALAEEELAGIAGSDRSGPLSGSLLRLAGLPAAAGSPPPQALLPAGEVARWIGEAGRVAAARDAASADLVPDDFVRALQLRTPEGDPAIRRTVRRLLRVTARTGRTQSELERARQGIDSLGTAVGIDRAGVSGRSGDAGSGRIDRGEARLAGRDTSADLAGAAASGVFATAEPATAAAGGQGPTLTRILADIDRRTAEMKDTHLPRLVERVEGYGGRLADIDRRTADIRAAMPRAPTPFWLALAITGVIVIGAAAGIALRHLGPAGPLTVEAMQAPGN